MKKDDINILVISTIEAHPDLVMRFTSSRGKADFSPKSLATRLADRIREIAQCIVYSLNSLVMAKNFLTSMFLILFHIYTNYFALKIGQKSLIVS